MSGNFTFVYFSDICHKRLSSLINFTLKLVNLDYTQFFKMFFNGLFVGWIELLDFHSSYKRRDTANFRDKINFLPWIERVEP